MVYVTGDTHGGLDISKLFPEKWEEGWKLNREDFLIVLGDFGLLWTHEPTKDHEIPLTDFYNHAPWTTLWIPGNHENYDRIEQLERTEFDGMAVRKHSSWRSIYMLESGIQRIQEKNCLVFRGAESVDRKERILGISYWRQEIPSAMEFHKIAGELDAFCKQVEFSKRSTTTMEERGLDFVLSHSAPKEFFFDIIRSGKLDSEKFNDPTLEQLQALEDIIQGYGQTPEWYCGHFHVEHDQDNHHAMYDAIRRII